MYSRWGLLFSVALAGLLTWEPPLPQQMSIRTVVEAYQAGQWHGVLSDWVQRSVTPRQLTTELAAWIPAGGAALERERRLVAATFGLDVAWTGARTPWNANSFELTGSLGSVIPSFASRGSQGFVAAWAARILPTTGTVTMTERALWLAVVGLTEDADAWQALQREILPLARTRLPYEARLRLATIVAQTKIDLGSLYSRGVIASFRRGVLRQENLASPVTRRIPSAIRNFEPLLKDASLAGEVELRIGYLELRRRNFLAALERFDAARAKTTDPQLQATAQYFEAWVYEQRGDLEEAILRYRSLLASYPAMRNLATQLSALLFVRGERADAYAILDRALNAPSNPIDFFVSLERGDARFVPEWLSMARQDLRETPGR